MSPSLQQVYLYQPESERKLRLEVPTVFGRSGTFYHYTDEVRFSEEDAVELQRLDYVEISGDKKISRTHGVLDPQRLMIRDLNSLNGIHVNGEQIPTTPERIGPPQPVKAGDVIRVGLMSFVVQVEQAGLETLNQQLSLHRYAIVGPVGAPEAGLLSAFLSERKRFQIREASDWKEIQDGLYALAFLPGQLGVTVVGLVGEPLGDVLTLSNGAVVRAEALIGALTALPGSKVLALQATADPAGFEAAFRDRAFQDTILITSTVPSVAGLEEGIEPELGTAPVEGRRRAARGEDSAAYHAVVDGLDGLIKADTNVLDVDWIPGYEGALRVIVGSKLHDEYEVELSYRTDIPSSFRVRHHFDSSKAPRFRSDP